MCSPEAKVLVSVYQYSINEVHISNPCAWEVEEETSEVQDGTDGILQGWRTSEDQGSSPQTEGYWVVGSATVGLWGTAPHAGCYFQFSEQPLLFLHAGCCSGTFSISVHLILLTALVLDVIIVPFYSKGKKG